MSAIEPENARLFEALTAADDKAMGRLHARLVAAAERDGVLDVAYRTIATPVGELLLAVTGRSPWRCPAARPHIPPGPGVFGV